MSSLGAKAARPFTQPSWLLKFVCQNGRSYGWTIYTDGTRFAIAKRTSRDAEYHLFEKHTAVLTIPDRSKHRLVWKGHPTRAGRQYIAITLALSNAAGRIMRADGKAQCTQCRRLIVLNNIEEHPCKENNYE